MTTFTAIVLIAILGVVRLIINVWALKHLTRTSHQEPTQDEINVHRHLLNKIAIDIAATLILIGFAYHMVE